MLLLNSLCFSSEGSYRNTIILITLLSKGYAIIGTSINLPIQFSLTNGKKMICIHIIRFWIVCELRIVIGKMAVQFSEIMMMLVHSEIISEPFSLEDDSIKRWITWHVLTLIVIMRSTCSPKDFIWCSFWSSRMRPLTARSAFEGTQPLFTHVPPTTSPSMIAVFKPCSTYELSNFSWLSAI